MRKFGGMILVGVVLTLGCGRRLTQDLSCGVLSYSQETTGAELEINGLTGGWGSIAQSFQLSSATQLSSLRVKLQQFGTLATGNTITASIHADNSGSPAVATLSSGQIDVTLIPSTAASFISFSLSSTVSLSASTTYWLKFSATYALSSTNVVKAYAHDGAVNGYSDGLAKYELSASPGTWSSAAIGALRDLEFLLGC